MGCNSICFILFFTTFSSSWTISQYLITFAVPSKISCDYLIFLFKLLSFTSTCESLVLILLRIKSFVSTVYCNWGNLLFLLKVQFYFYTSLLPSSSSAWIVSRINAILLSSPSYFDDNSFAFIPVLSSYISARGNFALVSLKTKSFLSWRQNLYLWFHVKFESGRHLYVQTALEILVTYF